MTLSHQIHLFDFCTYFIALKWHSDTIHICLHLAETTATKRMRRRRRRRKIIFCRWKIKEKSVRFDTDKIIGFKSKCWKIHLGVNVKWVFVLINKSLFLYSFSLQLLCVCICFWVCVTIFALCLPSGSAKQEKRTKKKSELKN